MSGTISMVPDLETIHPLDWNNAGLFQNVASLHQGLFSLPGDSSSLLMNLLSVHIKNNE